MWATRPDTFGRDLFRTHSCENAFGPSKDAPFCSAGCITGSEDDIKKLNQMLDAGPGSLLHVGDAASDAKANRYFNGENDSICLRLCNPLFSSLGLDL